MHHLLSIHVMSLHRLHHCISQLEIELHIIHFRKYSYNIYFCRCASSGMSVSPITASVCLFVRLHIFVFCACVCVLASVVLCCRPLSSLSQCHQLLRQPGGSMKASERRPRERVRWSMAQSRLAAAVEQHWDAVHVLWVWVRDCTSVCMCVVLSINA